MYRYNQNIFLTLICLNLISCSPKSGELKTVEQLMEKAPDSALHLLQGLNRSRYITSSDKAFYALLMSQAYDKNHIPHESDSLINIATKYYDGRDPLHAGYAWFYMARHAGNFGDAYKQADALLKAQDFAKKANNNKLLSQVYAEKSSLYATQGEPDSFIVYNKLSYRIFKSINDKQNCILNALNLGNVYLKTNQPDSAIVYYTLAKHLFRSGNDTILKSNIYRSLALAYFKKGKSKMALHYLNQVPVPRNATDDYNNHYLVAMVFLQLDKPDSARYYLNLVKEPSEMAPEYFLLWQTLYEKEGDFKKALYYANKITAAKDSLNQRKLAISFAVMEKKYNYQHLHASIQMLIIKNNNKIILLFVTLSVLSIVIIIFMLWRYKLKKRELTSQKKLGEKEETLAEIEKENIKLLELQAKIHNILLINIEQYRKYSIKRPNAADANSHIISPILNTTFQEEIIACMDFIYQDISKKLKVHNPMLTEHDILICCLLLADFDNGKIATILNIQIDSINKHRHRLRSKLRMQNSDHFIDFLRKL